MEITISNGYIIRETISSPQVRTFATFQCSAQNKNRACFNAELIDWWLRGDSNPRHTGYEPIALTNWATQPYGGT